MNATMKKEHLRNYDVIPGPGTFVVKVTNTVKPQYIHGEGSKSRYIVNLRAATMDGFELCVDLMGNNEISEMTKEMYRCFMSGVIWENDLDDISKLPMKGEQVIASFDYIEDVLRCTAITLIPRKKLDGFDLDAVCSSRKLFKSLLEKR